MKKIFINKFNLKYILIGIINTFLGYWIGVFCYFTFYNKFGIIFCTIIGNIFAISISFVNFRVFVFLSKKNFFKQYIKSLVNYGFMIFLSSVAMWVLIEKFQFNIYLAQIIAMPIIFILGYLGNKFFVFK